MPRLFILYLQYTTQFTQAGLLHLDEIAHRLQPYGQAHRIIIDNALPTGTIEDYEGNTLYGGDNSAHEFSGWEVGIRILETQVQLTDTDVLLFANDSFFRNYDPDLQKHFTHKHLRATSRKRVLTGVVDDFAEPTMISGKLRTLWVRSNCFLISYKTLKKIGSLIHPVPKEAIFTSEIPTFFHPDSGLDKKYIAVLRIWLFREESDLLSWRKHWYKSAPLTAENYEFMRLKAYSILCEHDLSARVCDRGGKLRNIVPRPKITLRVIYNFLLRHARKYMFSMKNSEK